VQYQSFPLNYDAHLVVLDTDYKNYAVIWSCTNVGPVGHTESTWVMGRDRLPRGEVLQAAYGVLDKYRMNRAFFVQTDQTTCETTAAPIEAVDTTSAATKSEDSEIEMTDGPLMMEDEVEATTVIV